MAKVTPCLQAGQQRIPDLTAPVLSVTAQSRRVRLLMVAAWSTGMGIVGQISEFQPPYHCHKVLEAGSHLSDVAIRR